MPAHPMGERAWPLRKIESKTEKIFRVVVTVATLRGPKVEIVKKMKDWPTAEQAANRSTLFMIDGCSRMKLEPVDASPFERETTTANSIMKKLVQNMKS
mmetsp:Transcript_47700/g.103769  ORF Transcript_47700/g.103769 Transcript_47700/m.103769 type:complete len:99 (-) Transcript_47700:668-964(-)